MTAEFLSTSLQHYQEKQEMAVWRTTCCHDLYYRQRRTSNSGVVDVEQVQDECQASKELRNDALALCTTAVKHCVHVASDDKELPSSLRTFSLGMHQKHVHEVNGIKGITLAGAIRVRA